MKSLPKLLAQISFLSIVVASSLSINYLSAWTGPTALPPNNNVATPLNVAGTPQVKNGNLSVGLSSNTAANLGFTVYGSQSTTGNVSSGGELQSSLSGYGNVRMTGGNYGSMFRNDGANTYFLLTASGDQYGAWNALRPFWIDDATGHMGMGNGLTVYGGLTFPDGSVQTSAGSIPSSAVMAFYLASCPSGWRPADGTASTPDLRGQFVRGWSNGSGVDAGRTLASGQGDAIRNITGDIGPIDSLNYNGVFGTSYQMGWGATMNSHGDPVVKFDASRVVPTANENRPVNVALLYCVKN